MNVRFAVTGWCPSQNHIYLRPTVDGVVKPVITVCKSEEYDADAIDDVAKALITNFLKEGSYATMAQAKTALEAKTFKV
jgi:hypothetical protein